MQIPSQQLSLLLLLHFYQSFLENWYQKGLACCRAEKIATACSSAYEFFIYGNPSYCLGASIISLHCIFKLFNVKTSSDNAVTEEEIKAMITEGSEHGTIEEEEKEIIERVFHLGDRNITSLMTHRTEIVWFDVDETVQAC